MLFSKDPRRYWFSCLVVLAIAMTLILLFKKQDLSPYYEGFTQTTSYVFKENVDAQDQFYAEIYDQLQNPEERNNYILDKTVEMTQPDKFSNFLEIGSKTGSFLKLLHDQGFRAEGLEPSQAMINYSKQDKPELQIKCGSMKEPLTYEKGSFTHVISNGLTFYELKNKKIFFENAFFWLKPGGYLIIHLVNPEHFDTIIPGGKPPLLRSPQKYAPKRLTDTLIDFIDFTYKASFDFSNWNTSKEVKLKETFTDGLTQNIRQNEFQYTMESVSDVLKMASYHGFIVQGQVNLEQCTGDPNQYLVILERPQ